MSVPSNMLAMAHRSQTTYRSTRVNLDKYPGLAQAPAFAALVSSWTLALEAENKSERTITGYTESIDLLARWLLDRGLAKDPADVTTTMCREWLVELRETRSASTARTRWNG